MICVTLDIEWLSDVVIDFVADILKFHKVPSTWFVTHPSPAVDRLRKAPELFELGIHPNFMASSTHGQSPREVLKHCMSIVPDAVSMRSHGLLQSTSILGEVLTHSPIKIDFSLYLPGCDNLMPFKYRWKDRALVRVPFCWEDDFALENDTPSWSLDVLLSSGSGLRVFNFHPLLIYLNSTDLISYREFRGKVNNLNSVSAQELELFVRKNNRGVRSLFIELVEYLEDSRNAIKGKDILTSFNMVK